MEKNKILWIDDDIFTDEFQEDYITPSEKADFKIEKCQNGQEAKSWLKNNWYKCDCILLDIKDQSGGSAEVNITIASLDELLSNENINIPIIMFTNSPEHLVPKDTLAIIKKITDHWLIKSGDSAKIDKHIEYIKEVINENSENKKYTDFQKIKQFIKSNEEYKILREILYRKNDYKIQINLNEIRTIIEQFIKTNGDLFPVCLANEESKNKKLDFLEGRLYIKPNNKKLDGYILEYQENRSIALKHNIGNTRWLFNHGSHNTTNLSRNFKLTIFYSTIDILICLSEMLLEKKLKNKRLFHIINNEKNFIVKDYEGNYFVGKLETTNNTFKFKPTWPNLDKNFYEAKWSNPNGFLKEKLEKLLSEQKRGKNLIYSYKSNTLPKVMK